MDTTKAVTHVSICAGYGGIDLGLKRAIPSLRTVAFSEIEAFACANLVAKMEAGCLDPAPIWTDVKTFPWASFHGKVDILSGGYPCQPFSAAGKRLGKDDPRHLWPWIADGIRVLQPALCFFENVEGHITLGLRDVIGELEESGYRTTWGLFSAAEVGAPHQRKRVFILAHKQNQGSQGRLQRWTDSQREGFDGHAGCCGSGGRVWPSRPGQPQHEWEPPRVVGNKGRQLDNTSSDGHWKENPVSAGRQSIVGSSGVGNTKELRRAGLRESGSGIISEQINELTDTGDGVGDADCRGQPLGLDAGSSLQTDGGRQGDVEQADGSVADASGIDGQRGSPWIGRGQRGQSNAEAVQCTGNGNRKTEPTLGGNADGPAGRLDYAQLCVAGDSRVDELRLLGNGVVPATAERAFNVLASRLFL